jgi:hypothetical protein
MTYYFKYSESYVPSCDFYGEFEFSCPFLRPVFGQVWTEGFFRVYGGYGLLGSF